MAAGDAGVNYPGGAVAEEIGVGDQRGDEGNAGGDFPHGLLLQLYRR
jgi:hypothetical protein